MLGIEFLLTPQIQRALGKQAWRAFDVLFYRCVAASERATPSGCIRAKKRDAGRADMGCQMWQ